MRKQLRGLGPRGGLLRAAGVAAPPLYSVSAYNSLGTYQSDLNAPTANATQDMIWAVQHIIGGGTVNKIVMSLNNWVMGRGAVPGYDNGIQLPYVDMFIKEAWLTNSNGVSKRLTYQGQTSWTVPIGGNDYQCDPVYPSDFGLSSFPMGCAFQFSGRGCGTVSGVQKNGQWGTIDEKSCVGWSNSLKRALAPIDTYPSARLTNYGVGLTDPGNGWAFGGAVPAHVMLGTWAGAVPPVYMGIGDSIVAGDVDTSQVLRPVGWFGRAMLNNFASPTVYRARLMAGRGTGNASAWRGANNAMQIMTYWCKYANVMLERFGVNSRAYAVDYPDKQAIWSAFKSVQRGKYKTVVLALTGQTLSTDSWATLGNQSFGAGTGLGADLSLINDACLADVGTKLDYYLDPLAPRGNASKTNADYWRWAPSSTPDGLHPNATTYEAMAVDVRALLTTIEAAW